MSLPLLLSSLLIRPFPSSRHFTIPALLFPFHLALAPPAVFEKLQSPRHLHTARALERLAWAWLLLVILGAIYRTFDRVISGFNKSRGWSEEGKGDKNEAKDEQQDAKDGANGDRKEYERSIERGLSMSPIWTAAMCHLLAWRLATLPPAGVPGGWAWPWDVTTVVGLAGGAMSSWGEVWRLMRLVRPTPDMPNSGVLVRVLHGILALYRLVDAIRVISAATANSPLATALWTVPGG